MSEQRVGHCLPLYLQNKRLLSGIEDDDAQLPLDMGEDEKALAQFRQRAADQAASLLEEMYITLFEGSERATPYRSDRRTQRRTVREHWYVEGRLYRSREKNARAYWNLFLGCLSDKGPSITLVLGPWDGEAIARFDELSTIAAPIVGLESANARTCFTHKAGYDAGVIAAFAPLGPDAMYRDVAKSVKERADSFFSKVRTQFEAALDA